MKRSFDIVDQDYSAIYPSPAPSPQGKRQTVIGVEPFRKDQTLQKLYQAQRDLASGRITVPAQPTVLSCQDCERGDQNSSCDLDVCANCERTVCRYCRIQRTDHVNVCLSCA